MRPIIIYPKTSELRHLLTKLAVMYDSRAISLTAKQSEDLELFLFGEELQNIISAKKAKAATPKKTKKKTTGERHPS